MFSFKAACMSDSITHMTQLKSGVFIKMNVSLLANAALVAHCGSLVVTFWLDSSYLMFAFYRE